MRACVRACVCVCVRERERERERETETETDRDRETETVRDRDSERQTDTEKHRQTGGGGGRNGTESFFVRQFQRTRAMYQNQIDLCDRKWRRLVPVVLPARSADRSVVVKSLMHCFTGIVFLVFLLLLFLFCFG